jgi:hypothetical protein
VAIELVLRVRVRLGDVPHHPGSRVHPHRDPHPLRDRHRRLRLHLAVRLPARLRASCNQWFGLGDFNWFGERWSSLFVITLSEIWKTTPFISLLLLAGLVQVPYELRRRPASTGRRPGSACPGDPAQHEGGHHGGAAVPHPRRVAHLRQPVHHAAGANQTETLSLLASGRTSRW